MTDYIDPDHVAATRVISVICTPVGDGSGPWEIRFDYDNWISPYEAFALLRAGKERLETQLYEVAEEREE